MEVLTMAEYQKREQELTDEECFMMPFAIHGEPHMYIVHPITARATNYDR